LLSSGWRAVAAREAPFDDEREKLKRLREAVAVADAAVARGAYRDLRPDQIESFMPSLQRRVIMRRRTRQYEFEEHAECPRATSA
jgi:hypothetical protein